MSVTSKAPTTSLEIGGSVFNSVTALQGLISACSEDDVYAQAILAAEQLLAWIPAAPKRIGEAVDALGGHTSVRLENIKAWIACGPEGSARPFDSLHHLYSSSCYVSPAKRLSSMTTVVRSFTRC